MPSLKALLLTDGRPGHYLRAEGIAAALARKRQLEAIRIRVHRYWWMPGRVLPGLIRRGMTPSQILKLAYGIDAVDIPAADVVISAGGNTLAANIACGRLLDVSNIFYGNIRRFEPTQFSLVLTSHDADAALPRHRITPVMPVPINPDTLSQPADAALGSDRVSQFMGLLIGGDGGGVRYQQSDWKKLVNFVFAMHERHGTRWIVANSRRTPHRVSDEVARHAAMAPAVIESFVDVRSAEPGILFQLIGRTQSIVCTGDSSSMISEAIWLRRSLISAVPDGTHFTPRAQAYQDQLVRHGWMRSTTISSLSPDRAMMLLSEITPPQSNLLDSLADTIEQEMPALFGTPATAATHSRFVPQ